MPNARFSPLTAVVALIAVAAVTARFYLMVKTGSTAEDFYITLRYAENLARGQGFVYNPGERVLGTTTPLYTLALALIARLGMDPVLIGKSLNILADGVSCWLIYRLGRAAGRPLMGAVAASLLAVSPPNLTWAVSGMETALVTLCGLAVFVALAEKRPRLMASCAAILALLRIDGLLAALTAFSTLFFSKKHRRSALPAVVLFLLLLAPWTVFASLYFGSPVPTSAVAKLTVYSWHSRAPFPNILPFIHQMTHSPLHWVLLAGAILGLTSLLLTPSAQRLHPLFPPALWMLLYYAGMALSKGFLFGWYYVPPSPIYYLLAALGWEWAVRRWALGVGRSGSTLSPSLFILPTAVLLLGLARLPVVRADLLREQEGENRLRKPIGLALRRLIRPGERLMLEPIGYIGYFSGARILDAVGLVSPEAIPFYRRGAISPYLDMLHALRPEWILLRTGEYDDALRAHVPVGRGLLETCILVRTFSDPLAPPGSRPAFYLLRRRM